MSKHNLELSSIVVPECGRKDLGRIEPLAASIEEVGLLHPLVLNSRLELIAGRRRLAALKSLGWKAAPVRIVKNLDDAVAALHAERDENFFRLDLSTEERLELGRRLEALEKPKAKERKTKGTNQHTEPSGKLPEGSRGNTRDKVAAALGVSGKTYEKMKQVKEAAEKEPEKFGDLPAVMDAKSIDAAHKELKARQREPEPEPEEEADEEPGDDNQDVTPEELSKIRRLADFDLVMLISEISDHGWQTARRTLEMMPLPDAA
jgi:ParB-like chromosome segregation protein Spo0J